MRRSLFFGHGASPGPCRQDSVVSFSSGEEEPTLSANSRLTSAAKSGDAAPFWIHGLVEMPAVTDVGVRGAIPSPTRLLKRVWPAVTPMATQEKIMKVNLPSFQPGTPVKLKARSTIFRHNRSLSLPQTAEAELRQISAHIRALKCRCILAPPPFAQCSARVPSHRFLAVRMDPRRA